MSDYGRTLTLLGLAILVLNLPFGYWRAGTRKLSRPWFLAVHLPVPLIIGLRLLSGIGFHLSSLPVTIGAYAVGQFVGGRLRAQRASRHPSAGL
jgi:hypothetical protein